jgi:hypothetical protein
LIISGREAGREDSFNKTIFFHTARENRNGCGECAKLFTTGLALHAVVSYLASIDVIHTQYQACYWSLLIGPYDSVSFWFLQPDQNTLACSYAALILHDEGLPINVENINKLLKASSVEVESFWPGMFAKALQTAKVGDLISSVGTGESARNQFSQYEIFLLRELRRLLL